MLETFLPSLWPIGSPFTLFSVYFYTINCSFGNGLGSLFWKWVLDLHIWQQLAI